MHWLQTLDTDLFLFVNRSLVNPFFDWLMPILSNNGIFFPLLFLLGLGLLWKGGVRLRLCIIMLAVILPLGDNFIINTVKHAVDRPRPFAVLPEARRFGHVGDGYSAPETGGNGQEMSYHQGGTSMPSSHASNWFAATMICFIYCRRSAWFMLPLALAVSFSRVYNGVHYPSDVLAGAILGAGYAVALMVMIQTAWQWLGRKWFPLWHAQLPSLLDPKMQEPAPGAPLDTRHSTLDTHWLHLGYLLILVMLVGRWLYLASGTIELAEDEAYQWLWSKHLALSYYSKPLGIALIQFTGTSLWGDTAFGIRFFSPLFAAILGLMVLRFFAQEVNARAGFWLLLIVTAAPLLAVGTILMTIDPPLVLCWTWALVAGWRAVQADGKTRDWLVVGLAMGLGFLCKYTAACQLVCWAVLFAVCKPARAHLRKPGPWLALLVFLICTLPVIIWNTQHGWITTRAINADASLKHIWHPTLRYFWDFLFTQAGLLNPVFFLGVIWATVGAWQHRQDRLAGLWLYFFCMGAPLYIGYGLWSFHSRILPNWPVAGALPLFCLMVAYGATRWQAGARLLKPALTAGLAIGFVIFAVLHNTNLIGKVTGHLLPGEKDPLRRVRAWKQTAMLVENAREKLATEGKPAFIIADHYGLTSEFTFYLPAARAALGPQPLVYCKSSDVPVNQIFFWPEYNYREARKGQNAIFAIQADLYPLESDWFWQWLAGRGVNYAGVAKPRPIPERIAKEFESVSDLGEYDIKIGDRVFRRMHLWACHNLK